MAEFVPIQYRAKLAVRKRARRWVLPGILVTACCIAGIAMTAAWAHTASASLAVLEASYRSQSSLLIRADDQARRRQELADRMKRIEGLREDKTLLSLLRNVANGFGNYDCLEYIHVDARGPQTKDAAGAPAGPAPTDADSSHFAVHMSGITANPTTLADLMTRMGKGKDPSMQVQLESSKRENFLDGQVIRFNMACTKLKDG